MKEIRGDMWNLAETGEYNAVVITTNGCVRGSGTAVMGRGSALQAKQMFPGIDRKLGNIIRNFGNIVHPIISTPKFDVVSFPVKHGTILTASADDLVASCKKYWNGFTSYPGWMAKADLYLIESSAKQLSELTLFSRWETVILPRPGCGAGELNWNDVKPVLEKHLDDRFCVITY